MGRKTYDSLPEGPLKTESRDYYVIKQISSKRQGWVFYFFK